MNNFSGHVSVLLQESIRGLDIQRGDVVVDATLGGAGEGKHPSPHIDKALFDLGLSSQEIESSGRGFTFKKDEPLLMTFSAHPQEGDLTARVIVNEWDGENIETIIKSY